MDPERAPLRIMPASVAAVEPAGILKLKIYHMANTNKKETMTKYNVQLTVDKEWVENFNLTFEAADEQDAEAQALVEVKQNLRDYIRAHADEK